MHDGRVIGVGGGSSPLFPSGHVCNDSGSVYFVDGWQVFDPTLGAWQGSGPNQFRPGLPTIPLAGAPGPWDYSFCYYPLLFLLPPSPGTSGNATAYVFAATVHDGRPWPGIGWPGNHSATAFMPVDSGWPGTGQWQMHTSQIMTHPWPSTTSGTIRRNLLYPSGIIRPMVLDGTGNLTGPVEVMVFGGIDGNLYDEASTAPLGQPANRGRPALKEVSQIAAPEQTATASWARNGTRFPNLSVERAYSNAVQLPDGALFVVGGCLWDHYPYSGAGGSIERVAAPVFQAEMMNLFDSNPQWLLCPPHVSPRLYHSVALLLPDGRILVGGGYRGKRPPATGATEPAHFTFGNFTHSDIEIFSPDYLFFPGRRPQIQSLVGGGEQISFNSTFGIRVVLPDSGGLAQPAAAESIERVCLISPGSVTHHFGWDQRYVSLDFAQVGATELIVAAPAHGGIAPPGWYMLFIATNGEATDGVRIPSIAKFVKLQ